MSKFKFNKFAFGEQKNIALRMPSCLFLAILSLIWGIRCQDNKVIVEPPAGVLYGNVLDSLSNEPLEAWVALDSMLDTTSIGYTFADSNGNYSLLQFPANGGEIFCGMDGYSTKMREFQFFGGDSTNVNFRLIQR